MLLIVKKYWNGDGKCQKEMDRLNGFMPDFSYTDNPYVNLFIIMSHLYYDVYNNGGGNIDDCYGESYFTYVMPLMPKTSLNRIVKCEHEYVEEFANKVIELIKDKDLSYTTYSIWVNHKNEKLSKAFQKGFKKLRCGDKEYLNSWIQNRLDIWKYSMVA